MLGRKHYTPQELDAATTAVSETLAAYRALVDHGGALHLNNVVKYEPDESVLKLAQGERIALSAAEFERLSGAFLSDVRAKFVPV